MKIDFCTISSANYLPRVKILQQSLKTYHPESKLHILLSEQPLEVATLSQLAGHTFIAPDAVCTEWQTLAFRYEITEFNTALKPYLLEFLLDRECDAVIYFDPDIEIFSPLDSLLKLFEHHDLLLTPHVCLPLAMDGLRTGIDDTIRAGVYNLGFIGISGRDEARKALRWWRDVCRDYCYFDVEHRYFVDQFWAAALPTFVQRFHCLRDPSCNVAYWNVFQRSLEKRGDHWTVNDEYLKFFHFSGLPDDLTLVSRHQNRFTTNPESPLYELLAHYRDKTFQNSWSSFGASRYSFGVYADQSLIKTVERRAYDDLSPSARNGLGDPFLQPIRLKAAGRQLASQAHLTFVRKYFRLLAKEGFLQGHRTLVSYFANKLVRTLRYHRKES